MNPMIAYFMLHLPQESCVHRSVTGDYLEANEGSGKVAASSGRCASCMCSYAEVLMLAYAARINSRMNFKERAYHEQTTWLCCSWAPHSPLAPTLSFGPTHPGSLGIQRRPVWLLR